MKVLLTSGIYEPDIGGPATFIPALAQALVIQKHKVKVITLGKFSKEDSSKPWNLRKIPRRCKFLRIPRTIFGIYTESKNSEVIFANGLFIETALAIFLRREKIKGIAKIVGDPVWERAVNHGKTQLGLQEFNISTKYDFGFIAQRILFNWAFGKFEIIICPSKELSSLVKKWLPRKNVKVLHNGTNCHIFNENRIKNTEYDLILVSRLVEWKNVDKVLEALRGLNFKIGIIGTGPEQVKLIEISKSFNLNIDFLGLMAKEQVQEKLTQSKVFILYSDYEGLSFALIEAMANGLAVIASSNKGNSSVITNDLDGILVPLQDLNRLRQSVIGLLNDETKLIELGRNASKTVSRNYCKEIQLNKVIKEIERIQIPN
jgi:glycosyltransferase involved in cell wall biosynthesis